MRPTPTCALLVLVAACASHRSAEAPRGEGAARGALCAIPGVEGARRVPPIVLPPGCSFTVAGSPTGPLVLSTADALAEALTCTGTDRPHVDLDANDLFVIEYAMSPAYAGSEVFDDGAVVTFATRFRAPCPSDPLPMPMNATLAFALPKSAERTFQQATCTNPEDCD